MKGWGPPLLSTSGGFTYPAKINAEQLARAGRDRRWRLEIVGNLDAVIEGSGQPQLLSLTASEVCERATGWKYEVPLDGLEGRIQDLGR